MATQRELRWQGSDEANSARLLEALDAFGFGPMGLEASDSAPVAAVIQLGYPPSRIGLLTGIDLSELASLGDDSPD